MSTQTYTLKGIVILDNGKEMEESYGDINTGTDMQMLETVKDYLLPEWNSTAEGGYGKTLCCLDKIDNETDVQTRIYRRSKKEILKEIESYGFIK